MAKDSSFDIVSELDLQEMDNAVNQAAKEIQTRYDLKNTGTTLEFDRTASEISVESESDFTLKSAVEVLESKVVRREISLKALDPGKIEPASGARVRQKIALKQGISADTAREIVKAIKAEKLKVQVAIEGDKVRVSAKSRDLLQEAIQLVKSADFGIPIQFINYR